jgi:pimeloyl-ACP methyl ester carboxylesterase
MRYEGKTARALAGGVAALVGAGIAAASFGGGLSAREAEELIEQYFELDGRSETGCRGQDEVLRALDEYEPLDERDVKSWRKKLDKLWAKGPKLEKKSGRHYLWEDEERGLYIVGGEDRRPEALFIGMHGGGEGSGDAWSSHGSFNPAASKADWLAIFPQVLEKTECGWTTSGTEEFVLELVERARRTWKLDPDHVFLGGHSMGGYGTWTLGAHHADLVAGLTASAGAPTPVQDSTGVVDIEPGVVPNLRNVRFVIYQSDDDVQVPPVANRMGAKKLKEAQERWGGYPFEYWEESGRGHGEAPGGMKALIEKVQDARRVARPDKVVWQPTLPWKRQFYWLWWERPVANALVVAELDREANSVRVECDADPAGLYVLLDGELLDLDEELIVTLNGEECFRGEVQRSLAVLVSTGLHGDPARTYTARVPLGGE